MTSKESLPGFGMGMNIDDFQIAGIRHHVTDSLNNAVTDSLNTAVMYSIIFKKRKSISLTNVVINKCLICIMRYDDY